MLYINIKEQHAKNIIIIICFIYGNRSGDAET